MGHTSRKNQRADVLRAEEDHSNWALHKLSHNYENKPPKFRNYHSSEGREPGTGYYDDFVMVANNESGGMRVGKSIEERTICCSECDDEPAIIDERGEPICPKCGMVCSQTGLTDNLIRDPKAAGRLNGEE